MENYQDYLMENLEQLDKFTRVVAKVHGENHPELHVVRATFLQMKDAVETTPTADLRIYLNKIATITKNYTLPNDACQTYAATYELLKKASELAQ
ncbi:MAG: hypothetical protein GX180_08690 [Enterococcus sp.]|jgi:iron-sulfur cluster repair protein YtfE (RIC family)|nr:hypothetical protein [Enterococcus sp.]